jgi:hypothetical protein
VGGLYPLMLRAKGSVERALVIACPVCHEKPGQPCRSGEKMPEVHDARESMAFNGKKIWT